MTAATVWHGSRSRFLAIVLDEGYGTMTTANPSIVGVGTRRSFPVLADRLPKSVARDVGLVVGVAVFTALMAQVSFTIPGNLVPITGQTFAVLLAATTVGALRGAVGQLLYVAAGLAGLPVFADAGHGWEVVHGALGGYLVGFVLASAFLGWQTHYGVDRRVDTLAGSFLLASALIYVPGVLWLAHSLHVSYDKAIAFGVEPFVFGDLVKALAAGALLPLAWRFLRTPKDS